MAVGSHGGVLGHLLKPQDAGLEGDFWRRIRNPDVFVVDARAGLTWTGERTLDGSPGVRAP